MKNAKIVFNYLFSHLRPLPRIVSLRRKQANYHVFKKCLFGSENNFHMQISIHVQDELFVKTFHHINHLCSKILPRLSPIIKHGCKKEGERCGQRESSSFSKWRPRSDLSWEVTLSDLIYHLQLAPQLTLHLDYPREAVVRLTKSDFSFVMEDNCGGNYM